MNGRRPAPAGGCGSCERVRNLPFVPARLADLTRQLEDAGLKQKAQKRERKARKRERKARIARQKPGSAQFDAPEADRGLGAP